MGEQNVSGGLQGANMRTFMQQVLNDLKALELMISKGMIERDNARIGAEQEIFLIGQDLRPASVSLDLLDRINDSHFTTELGRFNIEINLDPLKFGGDCLRRLERQLNELIEAGRRSAAEIGIDLSLFGILPTLHKSDLTLDNMTPLPRYFALNEVLGKLRGGPYEFHIRGLDELTFKHDSMMVESCNTSFQIHLQVGDEDFAKYYNIAQAIAGPVLAVSTNSPLLFGKRLWQETRIALFQQAVDTRNSSFYLRERSPRVTFGTRWVKRSAIEIYQEDVSRFRPLLGGQITEDPFERLSEGAVPELKALRLHNGTIYRWNRACYGITDGIAHLRIENRMLPAGPSVLDEIANSAFWLGLMRGCAGEIGDITNRLSFEDASVNFFSAARLGMQSNLNWTNGLKVPAQTLVIRELLPLAREGLKKTNIDRSDIDRYLGVIEQRVLSGRSGSEWIMQSYAKLIEHKNRSEAINALTAATIARQKEGIPVSEWKFAEQEEAGDWKLHYLKVGQYMTTDLLTVQEGEPIDLVIGMMDWNRIRHVPVEDNEGRLAGLISYRTIIHLAAQNPSKSDGSTTIVSEVMKRDLVTVTPETPTLVAIELMQKHGISCLPVVQDNHLVGIVTERDFMKITSDLLKERLRELTSNEGGD